MSPFSRSAWRWRGWRPCSRAVSPPRICAGFPEVLMIALRYLTVGGQIGIDRSQGRNALAQIIEQAGAVLRAGRQVYIYPEGTRRAPGAEPQYKMGVAHLYAATGAPCLPVALNTGMYWGRRGFRRRPGVAVIEFLPVIPPGLDRDVFFARLQSDIEGASRRLMEEAKSHV